LRMRAAFLEAVGHSKIVLHMTNNMIIPWVGAADVAYDGEHFVIYPEMDKDFTDFWSLERMRVDYPGQWGTAVNFMHEYQGNWTNEAMAKAMRAYTGMIILHDALPSGNSNGLNQYAWVARDKFGIEADDVRFIGYWEKDSGVKSETRDVHLAGWLRPGKLLVAVVNLGERSDAVVRIDAKKLGLPDPAQWQVTDAEEGFKGYVPAGAIVHDGKGKLTVPIPRHDYRQIIIERKAQ